MAYVWAAVGSFVVGMLLWILQGVIRENRDLKKKNESEQAVKQAAMEEGVKCILRDRLIDRHNEFMGLGYISMHGLQNWLAMYNAYKALGGNGMIDHLKEDIEELPIK